MKQQRMIKKVTVPLTARKEEDMFFMSGAIRKRKVYYNVEFTKEQQRWIREVRAALKQQKNIEIEEDQTLLRYWYASNMQMQTCLVKLTNHYEWFHNPQIQCITMQTERVLMNGFVYSYGKNKVGRPFIIMNLGRLDLDAFTLNNYYQATNKVNNRVIKEQFLPGYIQTYDYILDLDDKFLSLPLSSMGTIIKVISDVYSMRLQSLKLINCTTATRWLFNRMQGLLCEQTAKKIKFYTKDEIDEGVLKEWIDEDVLQKKYGGNRQDIIHSVVDLNEIKKSFINELNESEYFSIQENEEFFNRHEQLACCGNQACIIY